MKPPSLLAVDCPVLPTSPAPRTRLGLGKVSRRLVERAVLHDHAERAPVLEDRDVAEGIAVDQQQVGKRARLDHTQLARHAHDLAAQPGGRDERLHGREAEDLDEEPEVARIMADGEGSRPGDLDSVSEIDAARQLEARGLALQDGHSRALEGALAEAAAGADLADPAAAHLEQDSFQLQCERDREVETREGHLLGEYLDLRMMRG